MALEATVKAEEDSAAKEAQAEAVDLVQEGQAQDTDLKNQLKGQEQELETDLAEDVLPLQQGINFFSLTFFLEITISFLSK